MASAVGVDVVFEDSESGGGDGVEGVAVAVVVPGAVAGVAGDAVGEVVVESFPGLDFVGSGGVWFGHVDIFRV